jgi:hypothetical protein
MQVIETGWTVALVGDWVGCLELGPSGVIPA